MTLHLPSHSFGYGAGSWIEVEYRTGLVDVGFRVLYSCRWARRVDEGKGEVDGVCAIPLLCSHMCWDRLLHGYYMDYVGLSPSSSPLLGHLVLLPLDRSTLNVLALIPTQVFW